MVTFNGKTCLTKGLIWKNNYQPILLINELNRDKYGSSSKFYINRIENEQ